VKRYWDGSVTNTPVTLAVRQLNPNDHEIRFNTLRGFYYKLESTRILGHAFTDEPGGSTLAYEGWLARTNATTGSQKYYRATTSLAP
jgi:hypothetical protein